MGKDGPTILDEARMLLLRYGFKSMTMDDVASSLCVSKKTLYQHVANKGDLVKKVMEMECERQRKKVESVREEASNAIQECFEFGRFIIGVLQDLDPSIHYDLEKYYPEAWKVFIDFKDEGIVGYVRDNLERGIQEGLYRNDLESEVIARIYTYRIDAVFHGELFPPERFSFAQVYKEMFFYHILGIVSEKGYRSLYQEWEEGRMNSGTL
ncbi:MAG: TetR/AcrR family transcriptional regulator [Flavobacteriales bacterium]